MDRTEPNCSDSPLAGLVGAARRSDTAASAVQLAAVAAVDTFLGVAVADYNYLWREDRRPSPVAAAEIAGGLGSLPLLG